MLKKRKRKKKQKKKTNITNIHLGDRGAYSVGAKFLAKIITAFQTYKCGYPCIYALNCFWSEESLGFQSLNTVQNVTQ